MKKILLLIFSYTAVPALQKLWYYIHLLWLAWMWYWYGVNNQWHAKKIIYKKYFDSKKPFLLFDVGANIWQSIEEIEKYNINNLVIHSFEPQKSNYDILTNKFKASKNVILNNLALWNTQWETYFYKNIEWDTAGTLNKDNWSIREKIRISTIDAYCSKNNINEIGYLKMDIEWHEYNALLGAESMIKEWKVKVIEFEFLWQNISSRVFLKDFWDLLWENYDFYRILPHHIYKIHSYSHLLEIYCLSNFVCIQKWLKKK